MSETATEAEVTEEAPEAPEAPKAPKAPEGETLEQQVARLTRELAAARGEAAKGRVTAKEKAANEREADVVGKVLSALGLNKDGEKVQTTDELLANLAGLQKTNRELQMREAVREATAGVKGADATRLLRDSVFLSEIAEIDPTDSATLKAKVTATLEAAPWLRVEAVPETPKRSGTDMSGGTGEGALTQEKFRQMSGAERNALYRTNPAEYQRMSEGAK